MIWSSNSNRGDKTTKNSDVRRDLNNNTNVDRKRFGNCQPLLRNNTSAKEQNIVEEHCSRSQ